jgi:hypothetical protein
MLDLGGQPLLVESPINHRENRRGSHEATRAARRKDFQSAENPAKTRARQQKIDIGGMCQAV